MDAPRLHRGDPAVADEVEPYDELVGPTGDDLLADRVKRGMSIVSMLRAALGVAARPHANFYGVHRWSLASERIVTDLSIRSAWASICPRLNAA
jgi:hypothetical protein